MYVQLCMSGVPALLGACPLPKSDRCVLIMEYLPFVTVFCNC